MCQDHVDAMRRSSGTPGPGPAPTPTATGVLMPGVMLAADDSGPPVGDGGPPGGGPNGVIPPPAPAPAAAGGCQLAITGDASSTVLVDVSSCTGDTIEVSVDVDGHTKVFGTLNAADITSPLGGNPCSVDP